MAKVLRVVAVIAGAVAVLASGGTALFGAPAFAGALGISTGALATIAAAAGVPARPNALGVILVKRSP